MSSIIRQALRTGMESLLPRSRFMARGPGSRKEVALTFDDGPNPDTTPAVLDALAHHKLLATFFFVGKNAEQFPELVQRTVREGHAIGHHSWSHSEPAKTSAVKLQAESIRTMALLEQITGRNQSYFRPPKGKLTVSKLLRHWQLRQSIVLWSSDPRDYAMTDGDELSQWATGHLPKAGEIVLLHDVHPWAAKALPKISTWRDQGFEFVPISAWLSEGSSP